MKKTALLILGVSLLFACNNEPPKPCAEVVSELWKSGQLIDSVPDCLKNIKIDEAYQIQQEFVGLTLQYDEVLGFKAATTSAASQNLLSIESLTSGVLFKSGMLESGDTVRLDDIVNARLEIEFGYKLKGEINREVTMAELGSKIASIHPVFEVPSLRFANLKEVKAPQFIAANAFASHLVIGPAITRDINPNEMLVSLIKDDEQIGSGKGNSVLGDQRIALLQLVNQIVKQGYTIKPDHLLITGSMSKLFKLEKGSYRAVYGDSIVVNTIYVN